MKGKQKRQAVALFRYGVIAPVLHAAAGSQARYFGRMARKELDVPGLGRRRYSVATFKSWLRRYRQEGLDGLLPDQRQIEFPQRRLEIPTQGLKKKSCSRPLRRPFPRSSFL